MTAAVPPAQPVPAPVVVRRPVEAKVIIGTLVTTAAGFGGALLNAFVGNTALLGALPGWAQFLVITLAPGIAAFLAGYAAPHTP
jgi:hypothetical protein